MFEPDEGPKEEGILKLGPMEVARLDNDPKSPENGGLEFKMEGGR
jgi:hypothetical protein